MEKFNQLLHGIYYLKDFIPLNLFMLDNRIVNRVLEKLVRELKNFVTNYFVTLNQVENRRMCDEFEEMSINSGERPKETPEVVALQNYLVVCREEKLFRLKSEIQIVKERVMFLLTYASLTRKLTLKHQIVVNLISSTFQRKTSISTRVCFCGRVSWRKFWIYRVLVLLSSEKISKPH